MQLTDFVWILQNAFTVVFTAAVSVLQEYMCCMHLKISKWNEIRMK